MDNIVLGFLWLFTLFIVFFAYVPFFKRMFKRRQAVRFGDTQVKADFVSQSNNNPGKNFVQLIQFGILTCVKTGNDGERFLIARQQNNFMKYATPEIAQALKKIGDSI